ncbi:hypothetical protein EYF80_061886 [Liparis tanakae]|uniref:Uncharacterized protein n=1 Tax=Liparis tanakae TaxID=230148 RepID=A0A4Z2EGG4_9TELE|nr:hypothetical protein EYF80_061886 [Liparis tanakae]
MKKSKNVQQVESVWVGPGGRRASSWSCRFEAAPAARRPPPAASLQLSSEFKGPPPPSVSAWSIPLFAVGGSHGEDAQAAGLVL